MRGAEAFARLSSAAASSGRGGDVAPGSAGFGLLGSL